MLPVAKLPQGEELIRNLTSKYTTEVMPNSTHIIPVSGRIQTQLPLFPCFCCFLHLCGLIAVLRSFMSLSFSWCVQMYSFTCQKEQYITPHAADIIVLLLSQKVCVTLCSSKYCQEILQ